MNETSEVLPAPLIELLPKIMEVLHTGVTGVPATTQIIIGSLIGTYVIARGLADHGKEGALIDARKNLMLAMTNGAMNATKTEAFHSFVENGDMKALLAALAAEEKKALLKDAEDLVETQEHEKVDRAPEPDPALPKVVAPVAPPVLVQETPPTPAAPPVLKLVSGDQQSPAEPAKA